MLQILRSMRCGFSRRPSGFALLALALSACGGGGSGGGGGSSLSISLSPSTVEESFTEGTARNFSVIAQISGAVSGAVTVVINDNGGSIRPDVSIFQSGDSQYTANFQTLSTLSPGVHSNRIDIKICSNQSCSKVYGSASLPYRFTVIANPTISALSPEQAYTGDPGFSLLVTGSNFSSSSKVRWEGSERPTQYLSPTQLRADISADDLRGQGDYRITVQTNGASSQPRFFHVGPPPPPSPSTLTPNTAAAGGNDFTLTVDGSDFRTSDVVYFNNVNLTTSVVSASRLTAQVPRQLLTRAGTTTVIVTNSVTGASSPSLDFTIAAPSLQSLSPSTATAGDPAYVLTVDGNNFVSGSTALWNGAVRTTNVISATRLTAQIAAADIANAGPQTVSVRNTLDASSANSMTVMVSNPVPALASTSPQSASTGGSAFNLTVNGTRFVSSSVVNWNGSARPTTYVSGTRLTAAIPASDLVAGALIDITVSTPVPAGGTSTAVRFTVNNLQPSLQLINASSAKAGCGKFLMAVVGSNIGSYSTVLWNGQPRATKLISPTVLQVVIPAADIASTGSASVAISNPAPGGGTSAAKTFIIGSSSAETTAATAFQLNSAHSGAATQTCPVSLPEQSSWSTTVDGEATYPLIAEGKVFVGTSKGQITAFDQAAGTKLWGPVTLGGGGPAYDGGAIYVVGSDNCCSGGVMQAIEAASGLARFTATLPGGGFKSGASARNGIVYTGTDSSTLYAVDGLDGHVLWTGEVRNGHSSMPAVTDSGVYVTYPCNTYDFEPTLGTLVWHDETGCGGGGGATPVVASGMVYSPNVVGVYSGSIFTSGTGGSMGEYSADYPPAIGDKLGYFTQGGTLRAIRLSDRALMWSFVGDGRLLNSPIMVNDVVFIASNGGLLYALDSSTGTELWQKSLGIGLSPGAEWGTAYSPALAAGAGFLAVPTGSTVTTFRLIP